MSSTESQVVSNPLVPPSSAWGRSLAEVPVDYLQLAAALVSRESPAVAVFPPFTPHSGCNLLESVYHSSSQPCRVCVQSSPDFHTLFPSLSSNRTTVWTNQLSRVQEGSRSFQ